MASGIKITGEIPESVEQAYRQHGEIGAVKTSILKYARIIDECDSARDMKPLVTGMFEAIDRLKSLEAKNIEVNDTPLKAVLKRAANE